MTVTLVRSFVGMVHRSTCYSIKGRKLYRVIASEIDDSEIAAFVAARKLETCKACLRPVVSG